ncbi:hypothetical protein [Oricola sp.]|uniref:hypothetical protein n=1 Tax=Oricola sp. TaxID=1979950 RepID=UPI0025FC0D27|nr:hypothetical protein [Oricola sp.]MCI5076940.1 hypothetical protein [Oricola sp.]
MSLACVLAMSGPAFSQDNAPVPTLLLELNALQQQASACRIVFLAENRLGTDLAALSFETVLIDTQGVVDRLTLFDFQALPAGRKRVRQFDLDNTECGSIGQVLINGAAACEGEGLSGAECVDGLELTSKTDAEIAG